MLLHLRLLLRLFLTWNFDIEAVIPISAFAPDFPMMFFRNALRDRKAQPVTVFANMLLGIDITFSNIKAKITGKIIPKVSFNAFLFGENSQKIT